MRSYNAKPIQSVLLVSLLLTACGGGGSTLSCTTVQAPAPVPVPVVTSTGTDFFLTLPNHLCASSPASCNILDTSVSNKLIVVGPPMTNGEWTFNKGVPQTYITDANGKAEILLDKTAVLVSNEAIEDFGIHVTSQAPVSIYVVSETPYSADGYLALPTAGLGTSYYVMAYAGSGQTGSEFAVVATQDNTAVTITPKAAGSTKLANVPFTVVLGSGQTYQFTNTANADTTGSYVTADKPVAVFSGHRFANLPSSIGYGDYLVEQLPDVSIWGKTHHTSKFSGRSSYTVRVMASQDNTTFTTLPAANAAAIGTLNAGEFRDIVLTGPGEFVSNNPVLVAQFMHGFAEDSTKGDPSMVIVTPAEQGMTDSTFVVHGLAGITGAYLNIVTETSALANLMLDNVAVNPALFTTVGGTSIYSTGTIPVAPGVHTLLGSVPYSALVYDFGIAGNAVSYAYPVAEKLSLPAIANPSPAVCTNNQVTVSDQLDDDSEHEEHASNDHHHHDHDHHHDDSHDFDA